MSDADDRFDFDECGVCYQRFAFASEKRPVQGTCGHNVCLECVETLVARTGTSATCPFCNQRGCFRTDQSSNYGLLHAIDYKRECKKAATATAREEGYRQVVKNLVSIDCVIGKRDALSCLVEAVGRGAYHSSAILRVGGAVAAAHAMDAFPTDKEVQLSGCTVFVEMLETEQEHAAWQIASLRGVTLVALAMGKFGNDRKLLLAGCRSLGYLAKMMKVEKADKTCDAVLALLKVMEAHQEDAPLQESACKSLDSIFQATTFFNDNGNEHLELRLRTLKTVAAVALKHLQNPSLLVSAGRVVRHVGANLGDIIPLAVGMT